jgi:predicted ATPase/signal transduction histidine kinase/CheY-like chemotaxis protein/tRNA A-37 threonylcarbamoyl transferase component Bud32
MLTLPHYDIGSQIYESANSLIYRGLRKSDNKPVILKMLKQDYPTPSELSRYRQEYDITHNFELTGIIKAYRLEKLQKTLVIILEDFGGESLRELMADRPLTIKEFLPLAIQITHSLGNIHKANIIHKDINPSNLVWEPVSKQLKIIDFGIASRLPRENPTLQNPEQLEGTLAYLSPEQTGRINRSIDYRTDLYSLGVTCYELLTGFLPFQGDEAMELVHCHLAKTPIPLCEINPDIPVIVSDIVMKLMAKNAEDRYQSAFGVKTDFEKCLAQLDEFGNLSQFHFQLAQNDFSGKLHIPQKLYGRENEIDILLQAFERVSHEKAEMMLIAGYSGVGKTALVHEVHKPMVEKRGYFAAGKFNQFHNIPYSALTQAFNEFCNYLLTENLEVLKQWRENILKAVGNNGQVLIDVIPQLELIIGPQPPVAKVGPTAAQNRFNLFFQNFFRTICQKNHPLVLFIDDLQWADVASLNLLELLMTDTQTQYFMMIGAYRDNQVDCAHPLMMSLEKLQQTEVLINTISLSNLSKNQVNTLICEALTCESDQAQPFSQLVYEKTQGNAFFTREFLKSLYEQDVLTFDFRRQKWQWHLDKIKALSMTDNVVELIATKIHQLPQKTQSVLKIAACLGNLFDLKSVSMIYEQSQAKTLADLWQALLNGLVFPLDNRYKLGLVIENTFLKTRFKFQHDRIQQAAYALIPDTQKAGLHLQIGYFLKANTENIEEQLFEIVDHLNLGIKQVNQQEEKNEIAHLNWQAGHKAKAATAYKAAVNYFKMGLSLLPTNNWQTAYVLTLNLHIELAEAEYLNSHFVETERLSQVVLQNAKTLLDQSKMYEIQIQALIAQNQMTLAIEVGLKVLELLEVSLLEFPPENLPFDQLSHLPSMTDPMKLAAQRILIILFAPIYIAKPQMLSQLAFTLVDLSLKHGNSPFSAFGYAFYGMLLNTYMSETKKGYQFAQLALTLLEKFEATDLKCKIYNLINDFIHCWTKPVRDSIEALRQTIQIGLEIGDIEYVGYATINYCLNLFWAGEPLESVTAKQMPYVELLQQLKQEYAPPYVRSTVQFVLNFMGLAKAPDRLIGDVFNESTLLHKYDFKNNPGLLFHIYTLKSILAYFLKQYPEAVSFSREALQYKDGAAGLLICAQHNFYSSLALLAEYPTVSAVHQSEYLEMITANQKKMENWAAHAPMNFQHKYDLVEAEKARVLAEKWKAAEQYEKAISGAGKNEYLHEEALAYELAAEFYLINGMENFTQIYLKEAHYRYQQWGALLKVENLEAKHPQLLTHAKILRQNISAINTIVASTSTHLHTSSDLDLASVMKASQTLSGEMVLSKLLANMMHIVIENAGAEKGVLLLPKENQWFIEAQKEIKCDEVKVLHALAIEQQNQVPITLIHYIARTQKNVVLSDATQEGRFTQDTYIVTQRPKSVLGIPLLNQGQLTGIVYLENNLTTGAFTKPRLQVLNLLSSQMAISIENALLYNNLEQKVTERTCELQQEIIERQRAEEAAKVASQAKTDFLSNMSHELRTPLNGILGYAQILKQGKNLDASQLNGLNTIYESGKHLLTLINDILDLSKIEARKLELYPDTLHLSSFIESIEGIIRMRAEQKDVYFSYEAVGELPTGIKADEKRLRQVLINLLGNAIKFTDKGQVTLRVSKVNKMIDDQAIIRFEVQDSGVGMTRKQLQKIFQPFEQVGDVKRRAAGTGLGLAISRQLIELMEGEIKVESQLGFGSRFWFDIPLTPVDVKAQTLQKTQQIIGYQGKRRTILIVDDNAQNREILVNLLKLLDFNIIEATNGQEGVSLAKEIHPDMIFMDLVMPVMTGFEAVQQLRQRSQFKETPIIANSASVFEADREKSLIAGCNAFLPKPIEEEKLYHILLEHLKVEWIYKEIGLEIDNPLEQSVAIQPPSAEQLEVFYNLAKMGNMKKIKEQATQLEALDSKYRPFASTLQELAKEFKRKQILSFIEDFKK